MRDPRSNHDRSDDVRELRRAVSPQGRVLGVLSFALVVAAVYLVMVSGTPPLGLRLGQRAPRDFPAMTSFECPDLEATETARQLARQRAPMVFQKTQEAFDSSRDELLSAVQEGQPSPTWERIAEPSLKERLWPLLPPVREQRRQVEDALVGLGQMLLASPTDWNEKARRRSEHIVLYEKPGGEERTVPSWDVVVLAPADGRFAAALEGALGSVPAEERLVVMGAFAAVLRPNIELDRQQTLARAESAARAEGLVIRTIRKGELILAKGAEVRKHHLLELEADREQYWLSDEGRRVHYQRLLGLAVVMLVLAFASGLYAVRYRPELMRSRLQLISFALLTLLLVGIARLLVLLDVPVVLAPVPLMVMVLCLVYDQRFGFEAAALQGLLVALAGGTAGSAFVVLMSGGMMAALLAGQVRSRSTLIKAGLTVGFAQWAILWGLGLLAQEGEVVLSRRFWELPLFIDSLCALGNGVTSGFLVSGLLPAIERLFGVTTDIRLLEWSDPNQPLLQRLLIEAPGTYHHSMLVGSLAADAAEAIGANPLLARVSGYFHDIGKLKKPQYFAENLPKDQKNPHDELSPVMSRLIIAAHPRDGAEIASRYGLPREVRDIILESHGSTIQKYFWGMAKRQGAADRELQESTFRYRLPEPRSKEAACVMLADAAESALRSLDSPSPSNVAELVHQILLDRLHDGQLDESGLTVTDLDRIEDALVRGLRAVFHSRIRYPDQEEANGQGPAVQ